MAMATVPSATLRALGRRDPALAKVMPRLEPCPVLPHPAKKRQSHFESLAQAIVYQQLAGKAAATIFGRVRALTPGPRFPKAEELLRLPEARVRGAGVSAAKFAALCDLAERSLDGRLPLRSLGRQDDATVLEELVAIRGIGPWTAQMFLMFKLGRPDVIAPGDLGLQEGLRRLDRLPQRPSEKELEARAEIWAPYRTIASWYLWRLADTGLSE
jgi:3-methyladenine DNA glycosylase/8-oxoguanine DNA glycosylase